MNHHQRTELPPEASKVANMDSKFDALILIKSASHWSQATLMPFR